MTSKKAKDTTERQTSFRARKKAEGYSEVAMWLKNDTLKKITTIAASNGITKGEAVDKIVSKNS
jgi:uncharacterized protein YpmB